MANEIEIKVPDIGGANDVDVIELLIKVGDIIEIDTPLITLESDKASMEIPSSTAGTVSQINLKVGDKVSEGDSILLLQVESQQAEQKEEPTKEVEPQATPVAQAPAQQSGANTSLKQQDVCVPDIGGATDVDVIDILVAPGDTVECDQALITLEGDKATMDIPSPCAGVIRELKIKVGAKVSQGTLILVMDSADASPQQEVPVNTAPAAVAPRHNEAVKTSNEPVIHSSIGSEESNGTSFAGPAVRRMARELGLDLSLVKGSGRKGRILKEDVHAYVKTRLAQPATSTSAFNLPAAPVIDFSKFGDIETKPLNKIKKVTGINVHRSWVTIPHVTQFDEADITDLEAFRKSETEQNKNSDYKLTLLAFVCAVVSKALQQYPQFNASLDARGENLIYKKYYNVGIAVETPNGLVVPVIKNIDQLSVGEIAKEMARLSTKAREKGLMPADMSGGCFTISSLGGIGGTAFTPIVNSPEVAILGLSRSAIKPVYQKEQFVPRLLLPLSLSYDHRVIDGAEAARFTRYISECLADIRKVLL